jgi:hypothetical protein
MPTKVEKNRRKALRREIAKQQRAKAEAEMPMSKSDLQDLFDHLDQRLAAEGVTTLCCIPCISHQQRLPEESIVDWLGEHGGFCDCEVLANVENEWGEG